MGCIIFSFIMVIYCLLAAIFNFIQYGKDKKDYIKWAAIAFLIAFIFGFTVVLLDIS